MLNYMYNGGTFESNTKIQFLFRHNLSAMASTFLKYSFLKSLNFNCLLFDRLILQNTKRVQFLFRM